MWRRYPWNIALDDGDIYLYCLLMYIWYTQFMLLFMPLDMQWKAVEHHLLHIFILWPYIYIWTVEYFLHTLYWKLPSLHSGETSGPRKFREIGVELPKSSQIVTWFLSFAVSLLVLSFSEWKMGSFMFSKKCLSYGRLVPFSPWYRPSYGLCMNKDDKDKYGWTFTNNDKKTENKW